MSAWGHLQMLMDVVTPHATNEGFRCMVGIGNACKDTFMVLKSIPRDTLYWSVQAIDNNCNGGPFAEENLLVWDGTWPSGYIKFTDIKGSNMTLQWERGNGDSCVVFMKESSVDTARPDANADYTPDAVFGHGSRD